MIDPNEAKALLEGSTLRALPLIPVSSILTEMPITPDSSYPRDASLAYRVYLSIKSYNHNLKLARPPADRTGWEPSARVVEQAMKVNEAVWRAHEEVSSLSEELYRRVDHFIDSVPLQGHQFRDGTWAGFPYDGLQKKLANYTILDPETFIEDVRRSLRVREVREQAVAARSPEVAPFVTRVLEAFVDKLLAGENGHRCAVELLLSVKFDGSAMLRIRQGYRVISLQSLQENKALDDRIVSLLQKVWRPLNGVREVKVAASQIDPAVLRRKLWASVISRGCQVSDEEWHVDRKTSFIHREGRPVDCWCHRRLALRLLHQLQVTAYNKIRITVLLTIGRLVPADVCELLFEFAMAAEEVPLDLRVTVEGVDAYEYFHKGNFEGSDRPELYFQRVFRKEYRCPRYQNEGKEMKSAAGANGE